jgi:HupE / UreJ protein
LHGAPHSRLSWKQYHCVLSHSGPHLVIEYAQQHDEPTNHVLIAVSILVSAVHAFRPIFPGREAWIAAFFGLIQGLAFAATLGRWERVAGILAFNLGIETMQMLVVVVILPSLMPMSRTRAYPFLRIGGAVFWGAASVGWIFERILNDETPVDTTVNAFARYALWIAITLFLVSLAVRSLPGALAHGAMTTKWRSSLSEWRPFQRPFFTPETQGPVQRRDNQ